MKMNIFQLAKAARRLRERETKVQKAIRFAASRPNVVPETRESVLQMLYKRAGLVDQAGGELRVELMNRRIGMPGLRDARPKRIQRLTGALPAIA
jgi:hypothetical protein